MGLVIKFLGQPYPGREITIDDTKDEVHFGRGIDCDVGFPEDMAIVSRSHFALKRELAGYKFVINREKPVFMNGRPVYDDQDMPKSAEIQLSGPTGPKLRIERTEGGPSNQVKTEILKPQKDLVEVVRDTETKGSRTARMLAGVALLLAVLAGAGYWAYTSLDTRIVTVAQSIPAKGVAVTGAEVANLPAIIAKNKESVYLVSIQLPSGTRMAMATASVVSLPDGTKALATNSHVADILLKDLAKDPTMSGATLVVTQPKGPDYSTLQVVKAVKHPGYDEFGAWQEKYFALSQTLSAARMEFVPGYDVALLYVDDPTKLGTPLTYASRDSMKAMKAGEQLVLIGYPSEQLNGTDAQKPEPTSQTGFVTSITTYFLARGDDDTDVLVQHSVPATGGASGSPMFNAKGEVVAFLNAGNIILYKNADGETTRQPSAALVNYAQRADLLVDLAEGKADAKMPIYRDQMAKAADELTKTPDQFLSDLSTMFGAEMGGQANVTKLSESEVAMDKPVEWLNGRKAAGVTVEITDPGVYLFAAASLDKRIIQTSVYEMQEDGSISPLNEGYALTPYSFTATGREGKGKLFVVVADMSNVEGEDKRAPGKVKLQVFRGVQGGGS